MDLNSAKGLVSGLPPWLLLGVGFVSGWLKSFWNFFYSHTIGWMSNKIKVELVVEEQDHLEAFIWVNLWMEKKLREKHVSRLRLQRKSSKTDGNSDGGTKEKSFEFLPSYGFYWIFWKKRLLTFNSEKKESSGGGFYDNNKLLRTITLELWGTRNRDLLNEIVLEAKTEFESKRQEKMKFYVHISDYWESYLINFRPLETIYLPNEQMADILADFKNFFESEKKYNNLGIPWRRTFLFEGPPGSGKSTLVQALSTYFKMPVYYFNAGKLSEDGARGLFASVSSPCIILMEDIDSINAAKKTKKPKSGEQEKEDNTIGLKPHELLNLIDGLIASEQRIVIMTTNHPEAIDSRLLRSGRVDRIFHIGFAAEAELEKFYKNAAMYYNVPQYEEFRKQLPKECTIADAQAKVFELYSEIK